MDRRLLRPRWLTAHFSVVVVGALFVFLGVWQLGRLEERQNDNAALSARFAEDPAPLTTLLSESAGSSSEIEYRRARAAGVFDADNEVLIRSQVYLGSAGFHVITPLILANGDAVLVNRGWVPLSLETVPVAQAPPPAGQVSVEGWVRLSQERPALGREDPPDGRLSTLNRIDIERIGNQVDYPLVPFYLIASGIQTTELPVPVDLPDFADEGPHLAYAIQWFGFAAVLFVGYFFLARRRLSSSQGSAGKVASPTTIS